MKSKKMTLILILFASTVLLSSCSNSSGAVWEDTKTVGRYLHRKGKLLWSGDADSRLVANSDEFKGPQEEDFIPLRDEDLKTQFANLSVPQPKESPGAEGSSIPGIDRFSKPVAKLADLYRTVYFNTDEHVLRKQEYYLVLDAIATHMKNNPDVYIFVAGHCDERASEAYNLALGTRRANTIRSLLIKKGVNPNHIYTISLGKEMPADTGHNSEAWSKNRRVEFKIYNKDN